MSEHNQQPTQGSIFYICQYPLDLEFQAILIEGRYLRLRDKLWRVLLCLVENKSILISRSDLIDKIWDGNYLTGEQGTTHSICHLRKVFKQYNIDATITTIPKRGYVLQEGNVKQSL